MKARIKKTGRNVDVYCNDLEVNNETLFFEYGSTDNGIKRSELFFEDWDNSISFNVIDWEKRRFELAKVAFHAELSNPALIGVETKDIVRISIECADAMIEELKKVER